MSNNLNDSSISSIKSTLESVTTAVNPAAYAQGIDQGVSQAVGALISDPIGAVIGKTLSSINKIIALITDRIKGLEQDIVKSVDNTGKVTLVGSTIFITLDAKDAALLPMYQAKIQKDILSISKTLVQMQTLVNTLRTIKNTATTLRQLLTVQEAFLKSNPISKASLEVFKKALQILCYGDMLGSYLKILDVESAKSDQILQQLIKALSSLNVQFTIANGPSQGQQYTTTEALNSIASNNLSSNTGINPSSTYTTAAGESYILEVIPYGVGQLIGRARDRFSGSIKVETAPSYIESPEELLSELETIIGN